jgi:hypothetical protein
MTRRALLVLPALMLLSCLHISPASAACAEMRSSGDLVFVGTAVATKNSNRFARFAVEEIWSGDTSLAPNGRVTIVGGIGWPGDGEKGNPFIAVEDEHMYQVGERYLVVATKDDFWATVGQTETHYPTGALTDGPCSASAVWSDALAQYRPTNASVVDQEKPIQTEPWSDSSPPYPIIILTTVFVAGGCLYLLFRRGSIAYRAREDDEPPSKS